MNSLIESCQKGGRICTNHDIVDFPLEFGAEFIHGEGAITHSILNTFGLNSTPVDRKSNLLWADYHQPAKPSANQPIIKKLIQDYNSIEHENIKSDMSLGDFFRMKGWTENDIETADTIFAQTCCAPIDKLSVCDLKREMVSDKAGIKE